MYAQGKGSPRAVCELNGYEGFADEKFEIERILAVPEPRKRLNLAISHVALAFRPSAYAVHDLQTLEFVLRVATAADLSRRQSSLLVLLQEPHLCLSMGTD